MQNAAKALSPKKPSPVKQVVQAFNQVGGKHKDEPEDLQTKLQSRNAADRVA